MFTFTATTAGFTRSTTVAKDGMAEACKSAVLTAPATAELEADSIDPPMAPEAMIATTAAEANIRPLPRMGLFEFRIDMVFSMIGMSARGVRQSDHAPSRLREKLPAD